MRCFEGGDAPLTPRGSATSLEASSPVAENIGLSVGDIVAMCVDLEHEDSPEPEEDAPDDCIIRRGLWPLGV